MSTNPIIRDLEDYLDRQPYDIECDVCRRSMDVISRSFDGDGDIHVIVRCPECHPPRKEQTDE